MVTVYVPTGVPEGIVSVLPSDEILHPSLSLSMENVGVTPLAQPEKSAIVTYLGPVVAFPGVTSSTAQQLLS